MAEYLTKAQFLKETAGCYEDCETTLDKAQLFESLKMEYEGDGIIKWNCGWKNPWQYALDKETEQKKIAARRLR